jgi:predicted lipoprotein DUF2380
VVRDAQQIVHATIVRAARDRRVTAVLRFLDQLRDAHAEVLVDGDALAAGESAKKILDKADPLEWHHLFSRQFAAEFRRAGFDIEKYQVEIPRSLHRLRPYGLHVGEGNWNAQWARFWRSNPDATHDQVVRFLDGLLKQTQETIPLPPALQLKI